MELWQKAFRDGFAPLLSTAALEALRQGLQTDDPALRQGQTTEPPPFSYCAGWPCQGACAIGYCGWKGEGLKTVAEVEEFFARMCAGADENIEEPAGCRWFLNEFDEMPRKEFFPRLLAEVERELTRRAEVAAELQTA